MIGELGELLLRYASRPDLKDIRYNCFDHRDTLFGLLRESYPLLQIEKKLLLPTSSRTFAYVDGRKFFKHAVLSAASGGDILVLDPYLPAHILLPHSIDSYPRIACQCSGEAFLISESVYWTNQGFEYLA
jgi:hypothetical protein